MCDVSVIIPTYNRAPFLERALAALELQRDAPRFEVIVIDDGSTDGTDEVVRRQRGYPMRALKQTNAGPGPARNAGVMLSAASTIVFIDDDVVPFENLIAEHCASQKQTPGVVIGRLAPPHSKQPAWAEWECRTLEVQYEQMQRGIFTPTPRQFYTANVSVPRETLLRAGLFDAAYRRAEDVELAYRLDDNGIGFTFNSNAVVTHDTPRSFEAWRAIATQYGECDVKMWRAGRSHILRNIAEELQYARNPATRSLVRISTGRPVAAATLRLAGAAMIQVLSKTGPRRLAEKVCGAYFNVLYMDAACRELGLRREQFWAKLAAELALADQQTPLVAQ